MADRRGTDQSRGGRNQSIQRVIPLGTSTVTTASYIVGSVPRNLRVIGIRFYGQSAPAAATLTIEVFERTSAGGTGNTLQSAATDIDFASAALAKTGIAASLTTTYGDLRLVENRLIEATVTAGTCTTGPGDLLVEIDFEPIVR